MVEGQPFYIVEFQHVKPGKGGAFVRTKLKSYLSGNVLDRTFRSGEKFDTPQIEECDMQFLYATNDSYTFMDTETYEQSTYEKSQLGSNADLLKENMIAKILIYEHRPITVLLPNFIELKVVDGEPGVRGDTASGGNKPVIVETGALADTVKRDARARNIPVNVVDVPDECDFYTPSIIDRAPLTVAVSSEGEGPVLARLARAKICLLYTSPSPRDRPRPRMPSSA